MIDLPDGWRDWRTNVDRRLERHGDELEEHGKLIVRIETREQIKNDNDAARHAKTPQLTVSLVSMGVSILIFVLQLIASRAGAP